MTDLNWKPNVLHRLLFRRDINGVWHWTRRADLYHMLRTNARRWLSAHRSGG